MSHIDDQSTGGTGSEPPPPHLNARRIIRWLLIATYVVGALVMQRGQALGTVIMLTAEILLEYGFDRTD